MLETKSSQQLAEIDDLLILEAQQVRPVKLKRFERLPCKADEVRQGSLREATAQSWTHPLQRVSMTRAIF